MAYSNVEWADIRFIWTS